MVENFSLYNCVNTVVKVIVIFRKCKILFIKLKIVFITNNYYLKMEGVKQNKRAFILNIFYVGNLLIF
jgi:hypothetical protein